MATNIILSIAKIMPTNAESSSLLECYAECSLSYSKIMPTRAEASSLLECYAECSLS